MDTIQQPCVPVAHERDSEGVTVMPAILEPGTREVTARALAGALSVVVVDVAEQLGLTLNPELAAALGAGSTVLLAYATRESYSLTWPRSLPVAGPALLQRRTVATDVGRSNSGTGKQLYAYLALATLPALIFYRPGARRGYYGLARQQE